MHFLLNVCFFTGHVLEVDTALVSFVVAEVDTAVAVSYIAGFN